MNNVVELNNREIVNVSGGAIGPVVTLALCVAIVVIADIASESRFGPGIGIWTNMLKPLIWGSSSKSSRSGHCNCLGAKNVDVKPKPDCRTACCGTKGINRFAEPGGTGVTRC